MTAEDTRDRLGALAALFAETGRRAAALADRQFSVTLQLLGVHGAILVALVVHDQSITQTVKIAGSIAIGILDALAVGYIFQKAKAYLRSQGLNDVVQAELKMLAQLPDAAAKQTSRQIEDKRKVLTSGFWGSAYFIAVIGGFAAVTIWAILTA